MYKETGLFLDNTLEILEFFWQYRKKYSSGKICLQYRKKNIHLRTNLKLFVFQITYIHYRSVDAKISVFLFNLNFSEEKNNKVGHFNSAKSSAIFPRILCVFPNLLVCSSKGKNEIISTFRNG